MLEESWVGHSLESIRTAASSRQEDMFMVYCWIALDNGPTSERKRSAMALGRVCCHKTEVIEQIDCLNSSFDTFSSTLRYALRLSHELHEGANV